MKQFIRNTLKGAAVAFTLANAAIPASAQSNFISSAKTPADIEAAFDFAQDIARNPLIQRTMQYAVGIFNDRSFTRYARVLEKIRNGSEPSNLGGKGLVAYCVAIDTVKMTGMIAPYLEGEDKREISYLGTLSFDTAVAIDRDQHDGEANPGHCRDIYKAYLK